MPVDLCFQDDYATVNFFEPLDVRTPAAVLSARRPLFPVVALGAQVLFAPLSLSL